MIHAPIDNVPQDNFTINNNIELNKKKGASGTSTRITSKRKRNPIHDLNSVAKQHGSRKRNNCLQLGNTGFSSSDDESKPVFHMNHLKMRYLNQPKVSSNLNEVETNDQNRINYNVRDNTDVQVTLQSRSMPIDMKTTDYVLLPLKDDQMLEIVNANRLLYDNGSNDDFAVDSRFGIIKIKSIQTLRPSGWLDDVIVSCFFQILGATDEQLCIDNKNMRSHYFNSHFMTKLLETDKMEESFHSIAWTSNWLKVRRRRYIGKALLIFHLWLYITTFCFPMYTFNSVTTACSWTKYFFFGKVVHPRECR